MNLVDLALERIRKVVWPCKREAGHLSPPPQNQTKKRGAWWYTFGIPVLGRWRQMCHWDSLANPVSSLIGKLQLVTSSQRTK